MRSLGPVVDVHAHAVVGAVEELVAADPRLRRLRLLEGRRYGSESTAVSDRMVRARLPQLTGTDRRIADMDASGVDVQVVSPSPAHYHYWADPVLALDVCATANRGIAGLVAQRPDRLTGLGLAPLQHPEVMVESLQHAVSDCGLRGVEVSSHAPHPDGEGTVELSDARLEPFWASASRLGAVILVHPFGCTLQERLDRFYLANTVGQPVENAVALSHLIFAGVLDRHPDLQIVAAHGGGYLPTYLGRSDHAWRVRPEARGCARPPSTYLPRLWFDSLVHSPRVLRGLVDAVGADRVLLGSDYPFDMGVDDPVERLSAAGLPAGATVAIAGGNAARLGLLPAANPPLTVELALEQT